ncbi:hypothetical protein PPL_01702 [Heterostelium album PN500]|uniref:Ankyrin repeat protein n=1 Tax=Heterostelium pallidum (strain ATCC 26659 / Pp 5 / PN500) TaxID=670386 RepID=D3B086_HETP5|nr:hypothetical protein PPL_01702 [Heterostelium album PN500]EFA84710.1 hypothetical protein PPL_01702 [Heterostelium album PN500]|eukprot:XP_020436823.1 hypothetical protein PPL_01702 [Heterostelium album PN500]
MSLQKELFNYVFKNIVTQRPIFNYVKWIHQKLNLESIDWESLKMKPLLLIKSFEYLDKKYIFTKSEYYSALEVVGVNGGVECFEWLVSKVNDNQDDIYKMVANLSAYHGQIEISKCSIRGSIFFKVIIGPDQISLNRLVSDLSLEELRFYLKLTESPNKPSSNYYKLYLITNFVKNFYPSNQFKIQKISLVHWIHQYLEEEDLKSKKTARYYFNFRRVFIYNWKRLIVSPKILVEYNYLDLLKEFVSTLYPLGNLNDSANKTKKIKMLDAVKTSIENGNIGIFKYLLETICKPHGIYRFDCYDFLYLAAKNGKLEIVKYLDKVHQNWDYYNAFIAAPEGDSIELLEYLDYCERHKNYHGPRDDRAYHYSSVENAAYYGKLEMIKWLLANRPNDRKERMIINSVYSGKVEVVKYLFEIGESYNGITGLIDTACLSGNLDVVKYLHENTTSGCSYIAMDNAANFSLETVQWLHQNRSEGCSVAAMNHAAKANRIDIVDWLHKNRSEGCTELAMNGAPTLEMVKWLHENRTEGCTSDAVDNSAWYGRLDIIKFLITQRGMVSTVSAMDGAASNGFVEVLEYLKENQTAGCSEKALSNAIKMESVNSIEWLLKNYPEKFNIQNAIELAESSKSEKSLSKLKELCIKKIK